ncbi:hypothetical protein phiMK_102 [Pseudomonas phage phiMK]|uniref:Phage protein Gp138 N-terminal domain-containing protein n=3 Tax=Pakpunavirus TaxID=1921407 RepID=A0AAF0IN35_9CAUD|nr:baseplate spike [Pseudomonas phage PaoP5]YP_009291170.1 baseplate spike [Pseudomonas phage phiMK]YP_010762280.1 hypothetical protein QE323_gp022 [Pseudomonas phage SPA05]YP_010762744.1 hypothetical protein QE326_gp069 [Pseudomonas phage PaZq-1]QAY01710.1 baseplate protein [Pseudomonas phage PaSzW-1]ALT58352.1 hypothetical protein PaoP5_072 [Pseudomonas phage PaoP5]AMQ66290.1 hypothetical protein phiMK_102 [Pseudomonas phage phiMK]QAX99813.1 hypothetical protein [Pseudomonas phage PaZq-1]
MRRTGLQELLNLHSSTEGSKQYTAIPCVVLRVLDDFRRLSVDVRPVVNDLYKDGTSEEQPEILSVPVIMPGTANTLISFPLNVGDTVLCVFSQRTIDVFKGSATGQPHTPNDLRKFNMADAIAIPGLFTFPRSMNDPSRHSWPHDTKDLTIAHNLMTGQEAEVRIKANGDILINSRKTISINAQNVNVKCASLTVDAAHTTWNGNIAHTGNYVQTGGTSTFNGIPFHTHKHGGIMPGSGVTAVPQA